MRIGIDYTAAVNQGAGIGRHVRSLVSAIAENDSQNEYVLFYGYRGEKRPGPFLGGRPNFQEKAIRLSDRTLTIIWHRLGLPLPLDLLIGRVDVFHSPDFVLPPLRSGARVLTIHDLSFLLFPEYHDEGLRTYLERAVPASLTRADQIVAVSENTKNDLICLLDAPPDRVEVVYNGLDERFAPVRDASTLSDVRKRCRLEAPFILNVGTIEPRKNLSRLIQAYAELLGEPGFEHQLVIAGKRGWLYDEIFDKVDELGLSKKVRFLGYVPEEDLPALYSLADLFVFPSLYEGFGLPLLEAMACGTPVIASTSSALPEVVGDAGLLVKPTDVAGLAEAMGRTLSDRDLRQDMVRKGLERSKRFTWRGAAEKILRIYQRAFERS
ncbi:MAG: glycosyltransferase family 4 protein [Chloroflexi bacterium]|nr:glycosyltransferase family 4 protein [Chloroflexota bacterium]MCL5074132.1 glycosyltransferase family 4 protein [Chloroflexota bacterium]